MGLGGYPHTACAQTPLPRSLPMLSLDVPTMLLMTAAASFTMAVALVAVRPERTEGIGLWALGLVLHTATYVLYTLRGTVSDWASIVLANALLSGTFAIILAAVHQFQGRALPWARMALPVLAMTVLFSLFIDDYRARIIASGVVLSLQLGMALWALWWPRPPAPLRGSTLLTVGLVLQILLLVVRSALVANQSVAVHGLMGSGAMQSVTFLAAFVVVMLASLGFILMTKDRTEADNRYFAAHDALTGLANRRSLILAMDRDVARAMRMHESYAVMMLDIDHFKAVNDGYGHLAGDQVLRHVARLLHSRLRAQDMVGRYGGEEFLALLPATSLRGAMELAESLRQAVEQSPCGCDGKEIAVTVSIGVCAGRLEPADGWDALIHAADQAMYAAKAGGRNRIECSSPLRGIPGTFHARPVDTFSLEGLHAGA